MGKNRPMLFEVLEPRILLSADGLLNTIMPHQEQDISLDNMREVVQYTELLDTKEQFEEQISQELVSSDTPNTNVYQPVFTLLVDDDKTNGESVDADLSVGNVVSVQVNSEIAVLSNDSSGDIKSKVVTTDDGNTPAYINDGEISVEETLSIEIRGPPASETINSEITTSSSINNEKSEADHAILDEYAAELQPDGTANLPGLVLVDPDLTNLESQVVYLDFDGEENVAYSGPVLVEGIDVPEFALPGSLAGQEEVVITRVVEGLERIFNGSGVLFTAQKPAPSQSYSTVYVGGDDSAFSEYGSFLGLAEQVDVGNQDPCDNAFVFSETVVSEHKNADTLATHLANVIAHEVGHLLGYAHEHEVVLGGMLSAVAWEELTGDPGLWPYADGPTQETVALPHNTFLMGTTVGTYQDQTAIFSVGGWALKTYSRDAPGTDPKYWDNRQSHFSIYIPATDSWISADGTDDIDNGDGTWTSVGLTGYNLSHLPDWKGTNSPLVGQGTGSIMDQCFYYDGAVYVFGGYPQFPGKMAKYDIAANAWFHVATLGDDDGVYGDGGGLIGSHWYKVHKEGFLMDYDLSTDTFGPDIPVDGLKDPQYGAVSGVIGNKLYIVDGYNAATPGVVYEIDPVARTVVEKSPAPTPVSYAGTVVYNGRLYLLGGWTGDSAVDVIQIYDPVLDKWWLSPDKLPTPRAGCLAEVIGETLYVGNGISNRPDADAVIFDDLWCSSIPRIPAEPGAELWVANYNGPGNSLDTARAITVDDDGHVYVTGESLGTGSGLDYCTIAYDSEGNELWVARYNGPGNGSDYPTAIVADNASHVYVTGRSWGAGTREDYCTVAYDSQGNELWVARYHNPWIFALSERGNAITTDNNGHIYVTGRVSWIQPDGLQRGDYYTIAYDSHGNELWADISYGISYGMTGAKAIAVDDSGHIYVTDGGSTIAYDSQGNRLWEAMHGVLEANAMAVDASGHVYVTGSAFGEAGDDYVTIAYDSEGNELWLAGYTMAHADIARAIAVDNDSHVYVTGSSWGAATGYDYCTIAYDSQGNRLWVNRYDGPASGNDDGRAIAVDNHGHIYVTGRIRVDSPAWFTEYDYCTVAYDSEGHELWVKTFDGPGDDAFPVLIDDEAYAIAVDSRGDVYVTGGCLFLSEHSDDFCTIKYGGYPPIEGGGDLETISKLTIAKVCDTTITRRQV